MLPTPGGPGDPDEPGAAAARPVQPLSAEAAWGMRALIMVLMFLLRSVGRGAMEAVPPGDTTDEATPPDGAVARRPARVAASAGGASAAEHYARAQRVAKSQAAATARASRVPAAAAAPATDMALTAANRRRAMYASAVTVAGTVAWVAGRRSGRRR